MLPPLIGSGQQIPSSRKRYVNAGGREGRQDERNAALQVTSPGRRSPIPTLKRAASLLVPEQPLQRGLAISLLFI